LFPQVFVPEYYRHWFQLKRLTAEFKNMHCVVLLITNFADRLSRVNSCWTT